MLISRRAKRTIQRMGELYSRYNSLDSFANISPGVVKIQLELAKREGRLFNAGEKTSNEIVKLHATLNKIWPAKPELEADEKI